MIADSPGRSSIRGISFKLISNDNADHASEGFKERNLERAIGGGVARRPPLSAREDDRTE